MWLNLLQMAILHFVISWYVKFVYMSTHHKCVSDDIIGCMQVTTEAALGLIGGTMGLLTGFSILSGVEIIYYMLRFIWL